MKYTISNIQSQILVGLFLTIVLVGCRPRGILHSWEMRDIMVDLHKTDALLQMSGLQFGHDEAVNFYYAEVLEQHGVTQAQFDSSLVWYTAHPQLFDKIYPKVLARLEAERDAYAKAHEQELNLRPGAGLEKIEFQSPKRRRRHRITQQELDSTLWVMQHGYPTLWQSLPENLVHDSEDKLLP